MKEKKGKGKEGVRRRKKSVWLWREKWTRWLHAVCRGVGTKREGTRDKEREREGTREKKGREKEGVRRRKG